VIGTDAVVSRAMATLLQPAHAYGKGWSGDTAPHRPPQPLRGTHRPGLAVLTRSSRKQCGTTVGERRRIFAKFSG
jgi:hypothetical protein